jgi:predicted nucleic acid-binding protein
MMPPVVIVLHPGARHASVLRRLLAPLGMAGNLVSGAHLAALAIEHGAGLRWLDLLRSRS